MTTTHATVESSVEIECPTIWGLDPVQLHDRYWAARGVQVVRQGERSEIVHDAELFLLTDPRSLVIFKIGRLVDQLSWIKPDLMMIRLRSSRDQGYREQVVVDKEGRFARFHRIYGDSDTRMTRVALTPSRDVAERWQNSPSAREGWRQLRRSCPRTRRTASGIDGNVYDRTNARELLQHVRDLIQCWKTPDATIPRVRSVGAGIWGDTATTIGSEARLIGPAWIGAGRRLPADLVVGPAVLWDDPALRPKVHNIEWLEIEPSQPFERPVSVARTSSLSRAFKRAFDIGFSALAILATLPLYLLVVPALWLEDGLPIFFTHKRETLGGREFPCVKFRTMRNDSDQIKSKLLAQNQADGPQFFIDPENDPRLTRVGKLLRKLNIDELPQFFNVLVGHMSVVGPRPSPRSENQCCPPWREARLSVKAGITGLWQVMRTRKAGMDFQEWIKYDIRYVERQGLKLDLWIIWRTLAVMLKLNGRS